MQVRRLPRKSFYDIYVAAQQNFAWLPNHGIWKMIRHSKGQNCREKLVKNLSSPIKTSLYGADSEFICWKQANHTVF